jgi:hypothetical protein
MVKQHNRVFIYALVDSILSWHNTCTKSIYTQSASTRAIYNNNNNINLRENL